MTSTQIAEITARLRRIVDHADKGLDKYGPSGDPYRAAAGIVANHRMHLWRDRLTGREIWTVTALDGYISTFDSASAVAGHLA